jgi:hypothetical protein
MLYDGIVQSNPKAFFPGAVRAASGALRRCGDRAHSGGADFSSNRLASLATGIAPLNATSNPLTRLALGDENAAGPVEIRHSLVTIPLACAIGDALRWCPGRFPLVLAEKFGI